MKNGFALFMVLSMFIAFCGSAGALDPGVAPSVVSVYPVQNALNVPASVDISVTFDMEMNPATIDENTFFVNAKLSGRHAGIVSYNALLKQATFYPSQQFTTGEIVTVSLTTQIQSSQGTPLDNSFVWSFTIATSGGNSTFIPDTTYSTGNYPHSVFSSDFDGDGDMDLAVANQLDNNISLLFNDGSGHFGIASQHAVGVGPLYVSGGDFDGDGDMDLTTANALAGDLSVLINDGNGNFDVDSSYAVGGLPLSVFAGDLDGDGDIDLASADTYSDSVSILTNNGNGVFTSASRHHVGREPWFITGADLDSDGDIDLATSNDVSLDVSILLNDGDATFGPESTFGVGFKPVCIAAADLDQDGDMDLITSNDMSDNVTVLLNDGTAFFTVDASYPVADKPVAIHAADFDGDGDIDVATANNNADAVSILVNDGTGVFDPYTSHPVGDVPRAVFSADFDGDGDLDLATANSASDNTTILFNALICFDSDGDGFGDPGHPENQCDEDDCPFTFNPDQEDSDEDGIGDSCDICPYHPDDDCCNPIGINQPPNIESPTSDTASPGHSFVYIASASDPDCDGSEVVLSFTSIPSWCTQQGDTIVGWCECDYADTSFKVQAFDGSMGDLIVVSVTIDKTNQPPLITDTTDHFAVVVNQNFVYYPSILDPDDTLHTISYLEIPHWCVIHSDSVVGTAPDSLSVESLMVVVADYCHADTISHPVSTYVCGDVDASLSIDIDDVIFLLSYIFLGGPSPQTLESGDANCSGEVDIDDMVYILAFIFLEGPEPCSECP